MEIKDIAINVKSPDDFEVLMELLKKDGFEWKDLTKPSKEDIDEWYNYEEETCICYYEPFKEIFYSDITTALKDGYNIMSFNTFTKRRVELIDMQFLTTL